MILSQVDRRVPYFSMDHNVEHLVPSRLSRRPELRSPSASDHLTSEALGAAERARGLSTSDRERLKQLERENRKLKRANEILCTASAFFAQAELDRRRK